MAEGPYNAEVKIRSPCAATVSQITFFTNFMIINMGVKMSRILPNWEVAGGLNHHTKRQQCVVCGALREDKDQI